jgi:hypothetical protein
MGRGKCHKNQNIRVWVEYSLKRSLTKGDCTAIASCVVVLSCNGQRKIYSCFVNRAPFNPFVLSPFNYMHVPMITSKAIGKGFAAIEQNLPLGCVEILIASCDYCSKKIIRQRHNVGHFARLDLQRRAIV